MNVLQVTSGYPPHDGGVERHVHRLAHGLADRGMAVTVRAGDRSPLDLRSGLPRSNGDIQVRRHRSLAPHGAFHVAPGLLWAIRRSDADLVHAHNYHSFPLLFATIGRAPDVPLVLTPHYHAGSASSFRDRLLDLYRPLGRWALHRADAVIAVSEWERSVLEADFNVTPTVIRNGIDIQRFESAAPEDRSRPYLLCAGRLKRYKSIDVAIRAMVDLPEYDLLVAGRGSDRSRLERIAAQRGVSDRVIFLGYVDDERLAALYSGAAVHLQLSEFEAFGLTVGEALAAGTPCVLRATAALTDWTEREDCVGVSEVDPETVAAAVDRVVGINAPTETLPTWDEAVESVAAVYARVTSRK